MSYIEYDKGDMFHFVQTFGGKASIERIPVMRVHIDYIVLIRDVNRHGRWVSIAILPSKDGSHKVNWCNPYVQNAVAYPDKLRAKAIEEYERRGGKL